jgi:hypothetical protein
MRARNKWAQALLVVVAGIPAWVLLSPGFPANGAARGARVFLFWEPHKSLVFPRQDSHPA